MKYISKANKKAHPINMGKELLYTLGFLKEPFFSGCTHLWYLHLTVITTHFCVSICFLNSGHTNFDSELGDGRIYCLTLHFKGIGFLPKTHLFYDSLAAAAGPSPTVMFISVQIQMQMISIQICTHTCMLQVLLQGFVVLWLPCSALALAELLRNAASPLPCLWLPEHTDRSPSPPTIQQLAVIPLWQLQGFQEDPQPQAQAECFSLFFLSKPF